MKEITIQGRTFQYKRFWGGEFDEYIITRFYDGVKTYTRKKYLGLFGPVVTDTNPKFAFEVYMDIESRKHTKAEVREVLERKILQLNRAEEIKRGEII